MHLERRGRAHKEAAAAGSRPGGAFIGGEGAPKCLAINYAEFAGPGRNGNNKKEIRGGDAHKSGAGRSIVRARGSPGARGWPRTGIYTREAFRRAGLRALCSAVPSVSLESLLLGSGLRVPVNGCRGSLAFRLRPFDGLSSRRSWHFNPETVDEVIAAFSGIA